MGAEQIEKTIAKMYMDRYLEDGINFMETQLLIGYKNKRGGSLEAFGYGQGNQWDGVVVPWPSIGSHCKGGLGRLSRGPLKTQISEVFLASCAILVQFANAIEGSIGGTTCKGDGNYSIPKLINMAAGGNQFIKPTSLQACKFV